MVYTETQIKEIVERLDQYEKIVKEIQLEFTKIGKRKRRNFVNRKVQKREECIIHLSFAGLNRVIPLKDSSDKIVINN